MVSRLFLLYVVVELLAVVGLASVIGLGWTLLAVLIASAAGLVIAGSQVRLQLTRLLDADRSRPADSALVALGSLLVVAPGLVSTAAGLLLLAPPTRAVTRPALHALAARGAGWRFPLITVDAVRSTRRSDYIDGEVIDIVEVDAPALPLRPD